MQPADNAEPIPAESDAAPAAARPPDNVVRLRVEPVRPAAARQPPGQTELGFTQPVPDPLADSLSRLHRTLEERREQAARDAGDPQGGLFKWARKKKLEQEAQQAEAEMRARLAAPPRGKLAAPPKLAAAQASLDFSAPPARAPEKAVEPPELELAALPKLRLRDELLGMELPLFAPSKIPDTSGVPRSYLRKNGDWVTVCPPADGSGAATVFDCDLVIYCVSHINDLLSRRVTPSRRLIIQAIDLLRKTGRGDGRKDYEAIIGMLARLAGTRIKTNIPSASGDPPPEEGFAIIDGFHILLGKERDGMRKNPQTGEMEPCKIVRVLKFSITLSKWFYENACAAGHLLKIDPAYFALDSGIARRLYQIARRHCGKKAMWKMSFTRLAEKIGVRREPRKLLHDICQLILDDRIPGYHLALDRQTKTFYVVFYRKADGTDAAAQAAANKALADELLKLSKKGEDGFNAFEWFAGLEKTGSDRIQTKPTLAERKRRKKALADSRKAGAAEGGNV